MAASQKVTVTEVEGVAKVATEDATLLDIVTTIVSPDVVVTGMYGLIQKGALVVAGMSVQEFRRSGSWNPLR